jgi:hypothetical protein
MTSNYLKSLVEAGNSMLPAIRENRPHLYWHFKTCVIEAELGNESAARDLADQIVKIIEDGIDSCLKRGDHSRAEELTTVRESILEGVNS